MNSPRNSPSRAPVVLVTGGAAGIGLAMTRRFSAGGYSVAIVDINNDSIQVTTKLLRQQGNCVIGIDGSVTNEEDVVKAIARTVCEFGGLDVLINNAGISCYSPTLELSLDAWQSAVSINLTGVFLCSREAGRHMVANGGGVILNLGSMFGTVAAPNRVGYCATKGAVDMLTRSLAIEWACFGVRVNTIAPGYVRTGLLEEMVRAGNVDRGALIRRTPLGRLADAEEIAELAFFLSSAKASFITGQTIGIDGGWTAYGYV